MDSPKHHTETQADTLDVLNLDLKALPNEPQIDRYLNKYIFALGGYLTNREKRSRVPGAAVMVRKGNEIVHVNCYGYANLETEEQITPATLFDLGSLSKQFTAIAILGLAIIKQLKLNDSISKFFRGFPLYADSITLEQLIHHTSGLPDYIDLHIASRLVAEDWYQVAMTKPDDWYPQMANRRAREITNRDVLRWIASQKLLTHEPNTEFEYSNSGYVLLAEVVEKVTQMRLANHLKEGLFAGLGMNSTYVFDESSAFAKDAPEVVNHARCYNHVNGHGFVPVGYTPLNFIYGDGNVHSTIVDLAKWDLHLHRLDYATVCTTGDPSKRAAQNFRDLLWKPVQVENRTRVDYGAGWNLLRNKYEDEVEENGQLVTKKFESRAEYHRGEWLGWRSYIARASRWQVPEEGENIDPKTMESLGIVVLSNNKQFNTCRIAKYLSQVYWGKWKKDNIMNRFACE